VSNYGSFEVTQDGEVVTLSIVTLSVALSRVPVADIHRDIGFFLSDLRQSWKPRAIVLTGQVDGEFCVAPPSSTYDDSPATYERIVNRAGQWATFNGLIHTIQMMVDIPIPIIAKVNGDCLGFGQSLMFACDFIIAREDARISDLHMGIGKVPGSDRKTPVGPPFATVPGDGAGALLPLYLSPALMKEYLMFSQVLTAADLARLNVINRAVPAAELDATVSEYVDKILERPADAVGWTKRVANRMMMAQIVANLDAAAAYEIVNFIQAPNLAPKTAVR
jgi:enoyl-CoA hydratase/carnithine racemase